MLSCTKDTPKWVYTLFRRWHRLLNMQDWTVRVTMVHDPATKRADGYAHFLSCVSQPEYRILDIYISRDWTNSSDAWEYVVHELRHAIIDEFYVILKLALDRRRKLDKKIILKRWNELTEAAIQNEIGIFRNLDRSLH